MMLSCERCSFAHSVDQLQKYQYIDAARGLAILAVVAVHSSQHIDGITGPWRLLLDNGARGVQLFFIASAITLMMSWHSRDDGALPFYIRRLFRIAPLFFAAAIFYSIFYRDFDATRLLSAFTLTLGLHPATMNGVVPGGWSIGVEVVFYAVFPPLALLLRGWRTALIGLIAAFAVERYGLPTMFDFWRHVPSPPTDNQIASYMFTGPPSQAQVFMCGILMYFGIRDVKWPFGPAKLNLIAVPIAIAIPLVFMYGPWERAVILLGLLVYCLANGALAPLASYPIRLVGKYSYGVYIVHFVVLEAVAKLPFPKNPAIGFTTVFVFTVVTALILSIAINIIFEGPLTRLGHNIASRVKRPAEPQLSRPRESIQPIV